MSILVMTNLPNNMVFWVRPFKKGDSARLKWHQYHQPFGVQGAGKSYTLGTIAEMGLKPIPNINAMFKPLAGVIFHYSESQDYKPEFTTMRYPNHKPKELEILNAIYDAKPDAIRNIVLLFPHSKLEERRAEYPNLELLPLAFSSGELNIGDWRFLMGTTGDQSLYVKQCPIQ